MVNRTDDLIEVLEHPNMIKDPDSCGRMGCGWCLLSMCGGWGALLVFSFSSSSGCFSTDNNVLPSLTCYQRGKIRTMSSIGGSECGDCMLNFCCPCCSITQQYSDVKKRWAVERAKRVAKVNQVGYEQSAGMQVQRQ